jgi:hypothetical protein
MSTRLPAPSTIVLCAALAAAGCIEERCRENRDCPGQRLCNAETGDCYYECHEDADCGGDRWFYCEDHTCRFRCEAESLVCPDDMASVCGSFCIDVYEASRPDADATSGGTDESRATSREGVLPWRYEEGSGLEVTHEIARAACEAAGKRLCTVQEWEATCAGLSGSAYVYGDEYDPATCNSTDTFCDEVGCDVYPFCYRDCDPDFRLVPTGSFPDCANLFGVYDLAGNLWEAVDATDGQDHFRGGAYNCGDPPLAHSCGYDGLSAFFVPFVKGFRCCADGERP